MGISSGGTAIPAGTIHAYAGATIPAGWLECGGQAVSRATYAALFLAISTTYGAGDGSTTFNVPDMRGRAAFGKDDMGGTAANRITSGGSGIAGTTLGAVGGGETVTLTTAQMPSHLHQQGANGGGGSSVANIQAATAVITGNTPDCNTHNQGGGGAHANIAPAIITQHMIKI